MSLFEEIQNMRKISNCNLCEHIHWFDAAPFCKKKDKFLLPDFPPYKCEDYKRVLKKGDD